MASDYITLTVNQLRQWAPVFNGNVFAADVTPERLQAMENLLMPAAFVQDLGLEVEDNELQNSVRQHNTLRLGILTVCSNGLDRLGGSADVVNVGQLRSAIMGALLNWDIDPENAPRAMQMGDGKPVLILSDRTFYMHEFSITYIVTAADGFQAPSVPLGDITFHRVNNALDITARLNGGTALS